MKKNFIVILLFSLCCSVCYGQKWNYGVEFGYIHNTFHTSILKGTGKSGFRVGGILNYNFKNNVLLESGIAYERKGGSLKSNNIASQQVTKADVHNMDYLNFPFSIGYKIHIGNKLYLYPQLGWYLNVGLRGCGTISGIDRWGQPYTSGIDTFQAYNESASTYRPFNRIDTGSLFSLNVQYKGFRIKCTYELGLNTIHSTYGNPSNRTIGLALGYIL